MTLLDRAITINGNEINLFEYANIFVIFINMDNQPFTPHRGITTAIKCNFWDSQPANRAMS